ncbi:MAG TPA: hypothetical protein VM074_10260 [Solimonas sp.]|nr:hypothetical protein [Solimonas sp.]
MHGSGGPAPELSGLDRRTFLKLGAWGAAGLQTAGIAAALTGCHASDGAAAQGFRALRDADLALFRALVPAVVGKALPPDGAPREAMLGETLKRIDLAVLRLDPPSLKAATQLLDLLNMGLTRRLLAGVRQPWAEAQPAEIEAFLQRWRESSVGTFSLSYRVLVKLVCASFFTLPATWPLAGYPGPLQHVFDAVNHA